MISDQYLYLSDSRVVSLPSFAEVTNCDQKFPENPLSGASAGVVMVNGKRELQVCGGHSMTTCRLWTEDGWIETETGFDRYYFDQCRHVTDYTDCYQDFLFLNSDFFPAFFFVSFHGISPKLLLLTMAPYDLYIITKNL